MMLYKTTLERMICTYKMTDFQGLQGLCRDKITQIIP